MLLALLMSCTPSLETSEATWLGPRDGQYVGQETSVWGTVLGPAATVYVDGVAVAVDADGRFETPIGEQSLAQVVELEVEEHVERRVIRWTTPPRPAALQLSVSETGLTTVTERLEERLEATEWRKQAKSMWPSVAFGNLRFGLEDALIEPAEVSWHDDRMEVQFPETTFVFGAQVPFVGTQVLRFGTRKARVGAELSWDGTHQNLRQVDLDPGVPHLSMGSLHVPSSWLGGAARRASQVVAAAATQALEAGLELPWGISDATATLSADGLVVESGVLPQLPPLSTDLTVVLSDGFVLEQLSRIETPPPLRQQGHPADVLGVPHAVLGALPDGAEGWCLQLDKGPEPAVRFSDEPSITIGFPRVVAQLDALRGSSCTPWLSVEATVDWRWSDEATRTAFIDVSVLRHSEAGWEHDTLRSLALGQALSTTSYFADLAAPMATPWPEEAMFRTAQAPRPGVLQLGFDLRAK